MRICRICPGLLFTMALAAATASTAAADEVEWLSSLRAAQQLSRLTHKPVLIHFYADWCGPCKRLERTVFADPQVAAAIKQQTVAVKINIEEQPEVADRFGVTSIPADACITATGELIARQPSPATTHEYFQMIGKAKEDYKLLTRIVR